MRRFQNREDHFEQSELPAEIWAPLEAAIRASSNYVVPSDNLRPRTLEAAREYCQDRNGNRKLGKFVVLLLLGSALSVALVDRLVAWRESSVSPSAHDIQERALKLAMDANVGQHWGLFEAFIQLKQDQAARLNQKAEKY